MKSSLILCFVLSLFGFTKTSSAQTIFSDSGYSSVTIRRDTDQDGDEIIDQRVKTLSYHTESFWKSARPTNLLITETSRQHSSSASEGQEGEINLTAKFSNGGKFDSLAWKKLLKSNKIEYYDDYLIATTYGCCGAVNTKKVYRYNDGAKLMTLTSGVGEVTIPNAGTKRYIGYWDVTSSSEESDIPDSSLFGILTMVDPDGLTKHRLLLKLKKSDDSGVFGDDSFDSIQFVPSTQKDRENYFGGLNFDLWSADGNKDPNAYSNFAIRLKFNFADIDGSAMVEIPVNAGKFDISNLKSKWFDFELK